MDGHSYVTKGYSTYTDVPNSEDSYGYGPKQAVNYYVVETTTIERRHGPTSTYTTYGGVPSHGELLKEYMPKYAPKDHHDVYEPNYESDQEDSINPPGYRKRENLVDKFINKVQIGASQPTKGSNNSSPNKYGHVSPPHRYPSEEGHGIKTQNLSSNYLSPNKYRSTSPTHNYPSEGHKIKMQNLSPPEEKTQDLSEPIKYDNTTQTHNYHSEDNHNIRTQNFPGSNKYLPTIPTRSYPSEGHNIRTQNTSIPNKYGQTSSTQSFPSQEEHNIKTQNLSSPNKYQPTSPTRSYPSDENHKISNQNFPGPNNYRPTSPTHKYPFEEGHKIKTQDLMGMNKHQPTSPVQTYPSKEGELAKTSWGPNKHRPAGPGLESGRYVRTESFPGPNNHWQSVGPPMTRHPLTTPTNDINEALSFLTQSINHSPRSGSIRAGGFKKFGSHAQQVEPEKINTRPGFVGATPQSSFISNTIDSHEAMRKYNGALVP